MIVQCCAINAAASEKAGIPYLTAEEVIERTKNDPRTWDVFAKGLTMGVNQCQGAKTIEKLMRYKPRSLQDMSAFVAAIRPGFKSMVNKFLGREKFNYGVPAFDEQLHNDSTGSSWFLYQEDTMRVLNLAGFPLEETYPIIKAISKKKVKVIEAAHERFTEGFIAYQKEQGEKSDKKAKENAEMVWQVIYNSAAYQFNCLTGDTTLMSVGNPPRGVRIEELFFEYCHDMVCDGPTHDILFVSMSEDGLPVENTIDRVQYVGNRKTYILTLDDGSKINCTGEHKFPTIAGEKRLCDLSTNDWLYTYQPGIDKMCPVRVNKIEYNGVNEVFNVTMKHPHHNFVANNGIVTSNCSHSVAVALDAIYGAYLKAHYPLQYYTTLLEAYTAKGDKEKVALIKDEMRRGFDISIAPCRFREDNRTFTYDTEHNTVSDALPSIRNLSAAVAAELASMKDESYLSFTDLLYDMVNRRAFNATNIEVLIKMDYFREFGHNGKLMEIWTQFRSGEGMQFKKTYVDATQRVRLAKLNEFETNCPDVPLSPYDQLSFEAVHYGTPISTFPECRQTYVVMAVDTKYSPKLSLYSAVTGRTGQVKVKKALYESVPVDVGDVIAVGGYDKRPRYSYSDGKPTPIPGTKELWVNDYAVMFHCGENKEAS